MKPAGRVAQTPLPRSPDAMGVLRQVPPWYVIRCAGGASYEVVAGGRRLAALQLLAKKKRIASDHPVPCLLVADALARTASLTENVQREAMGPVEELQAWQALVDEGRSVEAIAADFGVTPLVVRCRLRLANVSPRLLADYQAEAVTLEQLMALSAHRTAALQAELARHPQVALVAVVHRLALRVLFDEYGACGSPIGISASLQDRLAQHAPDVEEAPAAMSLRQVRGAWNARLPQDPDALFAALLALPQDELLSLLAVCVASTVSVLASGEDEVPAAALAQAVHLDMHEWWTPTAEGYFSHVSKAKALEAVQAFAPDHVTRLSRLKKADIAREAERLAAGTGWLPVMLRAQDNEGSATAVSSEADTVAQSRDGGTGVEDHAGRLAVA